MGSLLYTQGFVYRAIQLQPMPSESRCLHHLYADQLSSMHHTLSGCALILWQCMPACSSHSVQLQSCVYDAVEGLIEAGWVLSGLSGSQQACLACVLCMIDACKQGTV